MVIRRQLTCWFLRNSYSTSSNHWIPLQLQQSVVFSTYTALYNSLTQNATQEEIVTIPPREVLKSKMSNSDSQYVREVLKSNVPNGDSQGMQFWLPVLY